MNIKIFAALLSVGSNTLLVIVKLIIAKLTGSVAIASEAIHSGIDFFAACIASVGIILGSEPADHDHHYGHGKYENIAAIIEGGLIFLAALWITHAAIKKLMCLQHITKIDVGIMVMAGSAGINFFVANYLIKIGKQTESVALTADGWHLLTDVYTSIRVILSLILIFIGHNYFKVINWFWLDPVTSIVVAIFIIKLAYNLIKKASSDLVDISLPTVEVNWIKDYLTSLSRKYIVSMI